MTQYLVVDIETNGEAPPASLIELGWQGLETPGMHGGLQGSMLFGLRAGEQMNPEAQAVHHIPEHALHELPVFDPQEWWAGLQHTDVEYVVAHNAAFEQQWLSFDVPWICTYKCALHAWPEAPRHSNQVLKYWLGIPDQREHHPPHRALPDATVTALILERLLQEHDPAKLVEWTQQPRLVLRMPFGKHRGELLTALDRSYLEWVASPSCSAADEDLRHACRAALGRLV